MKSVSFSLINAPQGDGADRWRVAHGSRYPFSDFPDSWTFPLQVALGTAISATLKDDDKYLWVQTWQVRDLRYEYAGDDLWAFEDGVSYTWDAATNAIVGQEPAPVEQDWLDSLVSFWAGFANTMATWAAAAAAWVWPLNIIAPLVVAVSSIVDGIFGAFFDFRLFWRAFAEHVALLPLWDDIVAGFQEFLDHVASLWSWFSDWWVSVGDVVASWWVATSDIVLAWISTVTEGLTGMLVAWSNFVTETLPTLFDLAYAVEWWQSKLVDIGDLISGAFTERSDFWAGWSDFRQEVSDFFADPLEWLLSRFTDWFLGPEV